MKLTTQKSVLILKLANLLFNGTFNFTKFLGHATYGSWRGSENEQFGAKLWQNNGPNPRISDEDCNSSKRKIYLLKGILACNKVTNGFLRSKTLINLVLKEWITETWKNFLVFRAAREKKNRGYLMVLPQGEEKIIFKIKDLHFPKLPSPT